MGSLTVVLGALVVVALLFYFRKWNWLWSEWLTSLDAKKIGIMYLFVAFIMLVRGAIDAGMMRGQQAVAVGDNAGYLSPDHFAQIFTAHGVIMILFMAMPFMFGLINVALPLQLGARDVAFPFLNSVSLWLTAAGAMLLNMSLVAGEFAATGWLAYPPLSELQYSPGVGVDYYIWAIQIAGAGSLISAINFIVTILAMRAKGMKLMQMPIFAWTTLGSMMLVLAAFPILTVTLALLALDRTLGMHFFTTDLGGNAMMYVNMIWAWGHPEVYILILPAFGIFSEIVPVFSQKKLFGYTSMVVATMVITVLSFLVWVHHFFTMGAGPNVNAVFGIATMAIAIPTGVKVFNWLFTMFRGRILFTVPMLWFFGFLMTFLFGGLTGVLMAVPGIDFQVHNSLFLVAHFHNMVIGGVVFGYMAGFTYWFPKMFGFKLNERLGAYAVWCWIIGFAVAFIPLYMLGLMGMTRRLDSVDSASGWHPLLVVAAIGAVIIGIGIVFQALQLIVSIRDRKKNPAGNDPWNGRTLEWAVSSPAPHYNFPITPRILGRDAWWMAKQEHIHILRSEHHEEIVLPKNTSVPLFIALFVFLFGFGLVWHIWWLSLVGFISLIAAVMLRSFNMDIEYKVPPFEIHL